MNQPTPLTPSLPSTPSEVPANENPNPSPSTNQPTPKEKPYRPKKGKHTLKTPLVKRNTGTTGILSVILNPVNPPSLILNLDPSEELAQHSSFLIELLPGERDLVTMILKVASSLRSREPVTVQQELPLNNTNPLTPWGKKTDDGAYVGGGGPSPMFETPTTPNDVGSAQ